MAFHHGSCCFDLLSTEYSGFFTVEVNVIARRLSVHAAEVSPTRVAKKIA